MSIVWIYREDYARAGYWLLPNSGGESFMAWFTLAPSLALLILSLTAVAADRESSRPITREFHPGLGPFLLWLPPGVSAVENRRTSIAESLHRLSAAGIPDTGV
jgi:heme O synthase-like polyprenyltransferase